MYPPFRERDRAMECQSCGGFLYTMTLEQVQRVAENPYAYVHYCAECKKLGAHIDKDFV